MPPFIFIIEISMREAIMAGFDTRGKRHDASDHPFSGGRFVMGALIVAVAAIVLSLTVNVPVPPGGLMIVVP
jgi:hypothetical protein